VSEKEIVVTGNTVIDALLWMRDRVRQDVSLLPFKVRAALDSGKRVVLITGHRRESFGDGFLSICRAIRALADAHGDVFFVYPVHLNPHVRKPVNDILSGHDRILLLEPLSYMPFNALMDAAYLVLTDSGGIQEEAPALGKPVLVMRDVTERPEGVEAGTAKLVGTNFAAIVDSVTTLLTSHEEYVTMANTVNPYGDGLAAQRICRALCDIKYS
jgi:UDP-N-acetylglucosamine 2-epimerase